MISLFDRAQQYIIAEATRTLSQQSDKVHDDGDALWLGTTVMPKESGICRLVVELPVALPGLTDTSGQGACIIPNLAKDERFKNKDFVLNKPYARFYCGVPIRSPTGAHIGSYCILDDSPRDDISETALLFMKDMAKTVMSHLEMARALEEHRRGERMVRGLGSFVEGKSTLRNWRALGARVGDRSYEPSRIPLGGEGQLNQHQQDLQLRQDEIVVSLDRGQDPSSAQFAVSSHSTHSTRVASEENWAPPNSRYTALPSSPSRNPAPDNVFSSPPGASSPHIKDDLLTLDVKRAFSRAANVIRESIEVEGTIFFDASINSFGGLVRGKGPIESDTTESHLTSSGGERDKLSASGSDFKSLKSGYDDEVDKMCGVLGFSTSDASSINGDSVTKEHATVPERFLKGLLRRHPKGKIFHFDQDGAISSGSSSEEDLEKLLVGNASAPEDKPNSSGSSSHRRKMRRFSRYTEAENIIKIFPGARSVALVPLWDSHRERWFAGGVVWTTTPRRIFTPEGELSYLAAFGSTIMAEIARLSAVMDDKKKTSLLGSISHELRSPLHGILGSVEMLEDTAATAFQTNMLHTIEMCGRTLLDTIDHLLDFTKINHFMTTARAHRKGRGDNRPKVEANLMSLTSTVCLDVITEEVIATVLAGHDTQKRAAIRVKDAKSREYNTADAMKPHDISYASDRYEDGLPGTEDILPSLGGVTVTLDIDKNTNWLFSTQAGAWRRIVMNLFANALKYTVRGYIKITLKAKPLTTKRGTPQSKVVLTITDSGKGMSKKYLQDGLFTPFAQEDRLSPGTGLGLSITRQIISSLGGRIDVHSIQSKGTEITVSLPLAHAIACPSIHGQRGRDKFLSVAQRTQGRNVCIIGFEDKYEKSNGLAPSVPWGDKGSHILKTSLENICRDWFGLTVSYRPQIRFGTDRMYLVVETLSNSADLKNGKLFEFVSEVLSANHGGPLPIVVVICRSASSAHVLASSSQIATYRSPRNCVIEYIFQPCGPRKLAEALSICFDRCSFPTPVPLEPLVTTPSLSLPVRQDENNKQFDFASTSSSLSFSQFGSPYTPQTQLSGDSFFPSLSTDSTVIAPQTVVSPTETAPKVLGPFLLVDDNHINLKILVAYMKKNHHVCTATQDGQEAFDTYKVSPQSYQTILMDISMPVMDGLESTRRIRGFEREKKLKPVTIILLTGLASASIQQEAFSSGANLFLTKPVRLKELGRILEEMN